MLLLVTNELVLVIVCLTADLLREGEGGGQLTSFSDSSCEGSAETIGGANGLVHELEVTL